MLCKRNKKLSWMQSINSSRTSTKEKKRVLNRKLSLEIYSRFEFSLLFPPSFPPPPPPHPLFFFLSLAVFNSHLFVRLYVCSPVESFVWPVSSFALFVVLLCLFVQCSSFVSSSSPVPCSDWKMK